MGILPNRNFTTSRIPASYFTRGDKVDVFIDAQSSSDPDFSDLVVLKLQSASYPADIPQISGPPPPTPQRKINPAEFPAAKNARRAARAVPIFGSGVFNVLCEILVSREFQNSRTTARLAYNGG